jgi:hypothetical protein
VKPPCNNRLQRIGVETERNPLQTVLTLTVVGAIRSSRCLSKRLSQPGCFQSG